jgi:hypothetical protein
MNMKQFLSNQTVLYVTLGISAMSLISYVMARNTEAILFFLLIGFVASHFSKNMTVVMLSALLSTNLIFGAKAAKALKEGLTAKDDSKEGAEDGDDEDEDGDEEGDDLMEDAEKDVEHDKKAIKKKMNEMRSADKAQGNDKEHKGKKKSADFSNLDDILENGMDNMDDLVKKQENLEKMITSLEPIIEKAGSLLDKVNTTNVGGIGDMMNKMTGFLGKM